MRKSLEGECSSKQVNALVMLPHDLSVQDGTQALPWLWEDHPASCLCGSTAGSVLLPKDSFPRDTLLF